MEKEQLRLEDTIDFHERWELVSPHSKGEEEDVEVEEDKECEEE